MALYTAAVSMFMLIMTKFWMSFDIRQLLCSTGIMQVLAQAVKIDLMVFEITASCNMVSEYRRFASTFKAYIYPGDREYTVIPRLTKIIRSGITFVSRNLRQPKRDLMQVSIENRLIRSGCCPLFKDKFYKIVKSTL